MIRARSNERTGLKEAAIDDDDDDDNDDFWLFVFQLVKVTFDRKTTRIINVCIIPWPHLS